MAGKGSNSGLSKGTYLELRVARLLIAEGFSPFVNVYFRSGLEPHSVISPDVDVMGCYALSDATLVYVHYDCKSGASDVISRILMLNGMRDRIPPGPVVYVRQQANMDLRKYAAQYGIRLTDIRQLEEREKGCVQPVFGDDFPSVSDRRFHETWLSSKGMAKDKHLGRILRYLDFTFWAEAPFTRIRRTLAAVQQLPVAYAEVGIKPAEQDILTASVLRRLIYSLLVGASQLSFLSEANIRQMVAGELVTENLPAGELQSIVESTAQLVFRLYGDPAKGPLRPADYHVPPPDYAEELASLLIRTVQLYGALTVLLPAFDALIIERVLQRPSMARKLISAIPEKQIEDAKRWLRSLRLFLSTLRPDFKEWDGWGSIAAANGVKSIPQETKAADRTIPEIASTEQQAMPLDVLPTEQ